MSFQSFSPRNHARADAISGIPFPGAPGPLNAITDVAGVEQRWATHLVTAVGVGSTPVRAFYYRLADKQSTLVAIATIKVTP